MDSFCEHGPRGGIYDIYVSEISIISSQVGVNVES